MIFLIIPIIFKIKHLEVANRDVKKMFFKCLLNSQEKPEWCVFLWTLRSFEEHPFYKTPPDDYFWTLTIFEKKKMIETMMWNYHFAYLTHSMHLVTFFTPWKHQKTWNVLMSNLCSGLQLYSKFIVKCFYYN